MSLFDSLGKPINLGAVLGRGGEGAVYGIVGQSGVVA